MHAWSFASPTLLVAALLLLPGCEDDECSLDLTYSVIGGNTFQQVWRSPGATCSYGDFGIEEGKLEFEFEGSEMNILLLDLSLTVGSHNADMRYVDAAGQTYRSAVGSGCVAHIYEAETVDWVREDHLRLNGIVTCSGLLASDATGGSVLQIEDLKFSIYAGDGSLYGY